MAIGGVDIATLGLEIDSRGFVRASNRADRSLRRLGKTEGDVQKRTTDLQGALNGTMRVLGALGVTVGAGAIIRGLINTNREFQRLQAQLQTVEGSAEGAQAAFARIERFAIETPFEIENLTEALVQLRVRGAQPTDDQLTALGNLASSFTRDITEVSSAVASATAGMTRPLRNLGFEASVMGDQIKLAFGDASTTVDRDAQAIIGAIEELTGERLAGAMEREMDTINGATSNLIDSLGKLARAIGAGGGLNDAITQNIQDLDAWTGEMAELEKTSAAVGGTITGVIGELIAVARTVGNVITATARFVLATITDMVAGTMRLLGGLNRQLNRYLLIDLPTFESDVQFLLDLSAGFKEDMIQDVKDTADAWTDLADTFLDVANRQGALENARREQAEAAREQAAATRELTDAEKEALAESENVLEKLRRRVEQEGRLLEAKREGEDATDRIERQISREDALREALADAVEGHREEVKRLVNQLFDLLDAQAALERQAEKAEEAEKAAEEAARDKKRRMEEEERRAKDRIRDLRDQVRLIEENARATIQFAEALGVLEGSAASALEDLVQVGGAIARIVGGDFTAIPSLVGGVASFVGGLFGGDENREARRLEEERNRILAENQRTLEEIRDQMQDARGLTVERAQEAAQIAGAVGPDVFSPQRIFGVSNEDIARWQSLIKDVAKELDITLFDSMGNLLPGALQQFQERVGLFVQELEAQEASFMQGLEVRKLVAEGRDKEARELRRQMQNEREIAEARAAGFSEEAIQALEATQEVEKLAAAREREQQAIEETQRVIERLAAFQESLLVSEFSPLSPTRQLQEARSQFEMMRELALQGDLTAAESLPGSARTLLQIAREVGASGPLFTQIFEEVQRTLSDVQEGLGDRNAEREMFSSAVREANVPIVNQLEDSNTELRALVGVQSEGMAQLVEEVQELREELRQNTRETRLGFEGAQL